MNLKSTPKSKPNAFRSLFADWEKEEKVFKKMRRAGIVFPAAPVGTAVPDITIVDVFFDEPTKISES